VKCGEEFRTIQPLALEQDDQRLVAGKLLEQRLTQLDGGCVRRRIDLPGIVEVDLERNGSEASSNPSRIASASHGGSMRLPLIQEADIVMS
jgi:hypothetical protein